MEERLQALDTSLRHVGHGTYRQADRVRMALIDVLRVHGSLFPKVGQLPNPQAPGGYQSLVYLHGTIPVYYRAASYNIPMAIWMPGPYPLHPPRCFVTPTSTMVIKPNHRHVDHNGAVYLPYLSQWNPASSNIVGVIQEMARVFGVDPPVRQRPAASQDFYRQTGPGGGQWKPQQPVPRAYPGSGPDAAAAHAGRQWYNATLQKGSSPGGGDSEKNRLVEQVSQRVISDLHGVRKELKEAQRTNMDDSYKSSQLALETESLRRSAEQLKAERLEVERMDEEVTKWLAERGEQDEMDVDKLTAVSDVLARQLIDSQAEEAALGDVAYYLGKALLESRVALPDYLKEVRGVERKRFLLKALAAKVVNEQVRLGVR